MSLKDLREQRVRLFDVSPVSYPAYPQTEVALRSLDNFKRSQEPSSDEAEEIYTDVLEKELTLVEQDLSADAE